MGKRYKGSGGVSTVQPDKEHNRGYIVVSMAPRDINFFMKIMEGYTHLGFATPLEPKAGLVAIHATSDTEEEIKEILQNFPRRIKQEEQK